MAAAALLRDSALEEMTPADLAEIPEPIVCIAEPGPALPAKVTDLRAVRSARAAVERGGRKSWIRRRGNKRAGFWYEDARGRRVTDEAQLERIKSLVLPPAWSYVRINPAPHGPLQAVGVDRGGRVQYRYLPAVSERRQARKYEKIEHFGDRLPALRRMTNEDILREGFPKERVLAAVVRLINDLYFRLGSEESVRRYRTYGVTTLRNHHLEVSPRGELLFRYTGKHHIKQRRVLVDEELAAIMRGLKQLGGSHLFNYVDDEGRVHRVTPHDVNAYIKAAAGPDFSAKDFRTWGGTLMAAVELAEMGLPESETKAKRNVVQAVKRVAERLGNTPTVCRNCYIHPKVLDLYPKGITLSEFRKRAARAIRSHQQPEYDPEEIALLKMLRDA